ncbi:hypothetical protein AAMO2058_000713700 [Amorphochlora amoebiformis]
MRPSRVINCLCLVLLSHLSSAERTKSEKNEIVDPVDDATRFERASTCLVIISVLMVISISWEHLQDFLDESSGPEFKPVLNALFEELTLTGFLGLTMTAIQSTNLMGDLSMYFFGEEEVVEELYERIHLTIFGVTVSYLSVVVGIMFMAKRERLRMIHAEMNCVNNPEKVVREYYEWRKEYMVKGWRISPWPLFPADNKQYDYHWLIIRNQFFKAVNRNLTSSTSSLVNPSSFDLAEYFSLYMILALEKIISIGMRTWLCVWLMCGAFYGMFLGLSAEAFGWLVLFFGWVALMCAFCLGYHLQWVSEQLLPPDIIDDLIKRELQKTKGVATSGEDEKLSDEKTAFVMENKARNSKGYQSLDEDTKSPNFPRTNPSIPKTLEEAVTQIKEGDLPPPAYNQELIAIRENKYMCGGCMQKCYSHCGKEEITTPHQKLFLFNSNGTQFYMFVIRFNVLLTAIYLATFIFVWMKASFCPNGTWTCASSMVVVFTLPFTLIFYYRHLVRTFTLVTSVEDEVSRKLCRDVIQEVVRVCKTKQCIRIVQLLTMMAQRQLRQDKKTGHGHISKHLPKSPVSSPMGTLRAKDVYSNKHVLNEKRRHYKSIFDMFDTDKSGTLEFDEMLQMLKLLGIVDGDEKEQQAECKGIMDELDDDGDEEVTFEEFFNWVAMSDLVMKDKHLRHHLVRNIFDKMDEDKSGFIDADELHDMLTKFDSKITNHDITIIIKEVGKGKTVIDFEDFHEFVEKNIGY